MNASNWGNLQLLWALAIVPVLVIAYAFDGQRRRRALERIGHLPMIRRMTASISPARRRWKAVLTVAAVALLVTTLARPQMQGKGRLTENRGLDLVVALDFSKSMLARDVYPSRLERAKAELGRLIDSLKGDRVGLIAFAGETLPYPLTVDYEAAKLFWRDLQPDDMPVGGTDLGRAIAAAGELLKQSREGELKRRPNAKRHPAQVILLLTDGEDTEGRGLDAARAAAKDGVKIFTLGIGSNERPFVQTYDDDGKPNGMLSDSDGRPVRVGLDEQALRQIAQLTGGEYLTVDPQRFGVERVQNAIAGLERTEEEARFEREPDDIGRYLLVPAFLLLVLGAIVRERRSSAAMKAVHENANANANDRTKDRPASGARAVAAMILFLIFPFVTGFDLFMRRDPNVEEGNKLLNAGKAEEALKAYDRAVTAMPEDPIAHFDRGAALYQLGKFPEAQKEFLHAAEGRDQQVKADAYYNMGNAWFQQQKFKEALEAYKHTLGLRPDDRRAKWNLELALKRLQEQKQQQQQQQQQDKQKQDQQQQQQQQQQQAQDDKQKQDQQQQQQQTQNDSPEREKEKQQQRMAQAKKEPPREIDKQDAEAVLDALERVEPTVQKEQARMRAGSRRPSKDW